MQNSQIKIFIATPMYGGMCYGAFAASVVAFTRLCDMAGVTCNLFTLTNESLIQRARNSLVKMFLDTDYTHMFFIDADVAFDAEQAFKMIMADKDIVCGAYPRKFLNWEKARACAANSGTVRDMKSESLEHVVTFLNEDRRPEIDDSGCVEVEYAGTGFMLIKRKVFEHLKSSVDIYLCDAEVNGAISMNDVVQEFFYIEKEPKTKRLLSEDYAFCRLWRNNGGKIHVAVWVDLAHIGTHFFARDV